MPYTVKYEKCRSCRHPLTRRSLMKRGLAVISALAGSIGGIGPLCADRHNRIFAVLQLQKIAQRARAPGAPIKGIVRRANENLARKPDPIPTIHVEGTLPGQGIHDRSREAARDFPRMLEVAIAWAATGDPKYLDAADRFLAAWAEVYQVSLNPIDEERFDILLMAADLVRGHVDAATDASVNRLAARFAEGYLGAVSMQPRRRSDINNWQSHRFKIAVMSAYAIGDLSAVAKLRTAFDEHLERHIVGLDGEVVDFAERDAIHYVVYSLLPLVLVCLAARAHRDDWLHRPNGKGASVATAIDWLVPYAEGRKTHQEFVNSSVRFDAERAQAGLPGFGGSWDRTRALQLFALATALDPRWRPTLESISSLANRLPPDWIRLLFL
jgi:hypothetical protein